MPEWLNKNLRSFVMELFINKILFEYIMQLYTKFPRISFYICDRSIYEKIFSKFIIFVFVDWHVHGAKRNLIRQVWQ